MGKKPIVSVTYENERISIKKQLTLVKMCVTSLLCGPWADLWQFYGFLCKRFSLYSWSDFTAVFFRWISPAASLECPALVNLYIERKPFT